MSKAQFQSEIDYIFKRLRTKHSKHRQNYLDKRVAVFHADSQIFQEVFKKYGIPAATAKKKGDELEKKAKELHNPKAGIHWNKEKKSIVLKEHIHTKGQHKGKLRSNYNYIQKRFTAVVNNFIKAQTGKEKASDTGHIHHAAIVDTSFQEIFGGPHIDSAFSKKKGGRGKEGIGIVRNIFKDAFLKQQAQYIVDVDTQLSKAHESIIYDHNYYKNIDKYHIKSKLVIGLSVQSVELNQVDIGNLEKNFVADLEKIVIERFKNFPGSDSPADFFDKAIGVAFKTGKPTKKVQKGTISGSRKEKIGGKSKLVESGTVVPTERLRNSIGQFTNELSILALLNARLPETIKFNMGKGSATNILNYRTGRFAESAKVEGVLQTGDKVLVDYTFMNGYGPQEAPYKDVFGPGGHLGGQIHKPGRDPEKLINKSIRQLAKGIVSSRFTLVPRSLT